MIRFYFLLLLAAFPGIANAKILLSNFDAEGMKGLKSQMDWINNYSSTAESREILGITGVDIRKGHEISAFIEHYFPVFVYDQRNLSLCINKDDKKCIVHLKSNGDNRFHIIKTPGSPIGIWVPYYDLLSLDLNSGYVVFEDYRQKISKPSDLIAVFDNAYALNLSQEARAIVITSYLFGAGFLASKIGESEYPIKTCEFSNRKFICEVDSGFGYFSTVAKMISELTKKCGSCTKDDFIKLSYLFSINALSALGESYTFNSGLSAFRKNEREYAKSGLNVDDLKTRYRFALTR